AEHLRQIRGLARRAAPLRDDALEALVHVLTDLAVRTRELREREGVLIALAQLLRLARESIERQRVLDERHADAEKEREDREADDEHPRHRLLVLRRRAAEERARIGDARDLARDRVPRALIPRGADDARVDDAAILFRLERR